MLNRAFILVWCGVVCTIVTISAGGALFLIAKNWDKTCIKNRQPTAHFLWIITISIQAFLYAVVLLMIELNSVEYKTILWLGVAASVLFYVSLGFFIHRIWMLFYKSLLQKSLEDFNIFDAAQRRASKSLSNFWIMQRHRLGNSMFMSVIWSVIFCALAALLMYLEVTCGKVCTEKYDFPPSDLLNAVASGFIVIFGLSMLFVQKCYTVSDSFRIATELIWTCLALAIFIPFYELLVHTDEITFVASDNEIPVSIILVMISMTAIQLLITYYYTWGILSRLKNQRIVLSNKINLKKVLKNKEWFLTFEKQLKQEYSIENLNFLVSCIQYRRMAMLHGNFGFESSSSDTDSGTENFEELPWREWTQNGMESEPRKMIKMAQDIFDEYCHQGAPQEISLSKQTAEKLSEKIENLSNIYGHPERDIFCEARREVEKLLSEDALIRFIKAEAARSVDSIWQRPQIDGDYEKPFLNSLPIDDDCDLP